MKLKFKTQAYQTAAVAAVVDCFKGQPGASLVASCRKDAEMKLIGILENHALGRFCNVCIQKRCRKNAEKAAGVRP